MYYIPLNKPAYDELYHHGIKGQKWGQMNGPPYPLSESDKSSIERRMAQANSGYKSAKKMERKARRYDKKANRAFNKALKSRSAVDKWSEFRDEFDEGSDEVKVSDAYIKKFTKKADKAEDKAAKYIAKSLNAHVVSNSEYTNATRIIQSMREDYFYDKVSPETYNYVNDYIRKNYKGR